MRRSSAVLVVLALCAPSLASAQDIDAHSFQLAAHDGDLRDPLSVRRPGHLTAGDFFFAAVGEYANRPLVFAATDSDGETSRDAYISGLGALNLSLGGAVHERVRFDLSAPVYVYTAGSAVDGAAAFGDMRLTGTVLAVSPSVDDLGGGLGLNAWLDLPTGANAQFLGKSSVAGGFSLAGSYGAGPVTLTGDVGLQLNPAVDLENITGSDALVAGLAVGVKASDAVGITAEVVTQPPLVASDVLGTAFPAEGILSLRSRAEAGGFFTIGGASGITRGAGVPNWRVFVGGGFGRIQGEAPPPPPPVVETCADGSLPLEGMTIAEGCYSPLTIAVMVGDTPATGTLTVTGPAGTEVVEAAQSGWITKGLPGDQYSVTAIGDGCLAGQAKRAMGDGPTRIVVPLAPVRPTTLVVDVVDQDGAPIEGASLEFTGGPTACGPDSGATASGGRLTTRAGAGQYQLVARAASYATYLGQHAVPPDATDHRLQVVLQTTLVEVTAEQIVILDKVYFETGKSVIKADSFELLNQIATTIQTVESIDQVEIAGHTDSRGSDAMNLSLSQSRAESVRTYLISKGVTPDRLVAKGYGETTPIASNNDAAGRESNRRVEFNLIDAPTQDTDGGAQ